MCSSIVIGIFTLFVTITTQAVAANHRRAVLSADEIEQSERFVIGLAKNFSSSYAGYLTQFGNHDRVVSPLSVFVPILMLLHGAEEQTETDILNIMELQRSEVRMARIGLKKYLSKLLKYGVRMQRRMFVPSGVRMNPFFIHLAEKVFDLEIEAVDNSDKQPVDSTIMNKWVAMETHGTVTKFFEKHNIGRGPSFALVSTVYFKGTWKTAFDRSETAPMAFHTFEGDSVDVPTMYTSGIFPCGWIDEIRARFIELPYKVNGKGECMSMFIFLPDEPTIAGWVKLIGNLEQLNLNRLSNSTEKKIEIFLPKFKIETDISLNDFIKSVFGFNEPVNFSGIFKSSRRSHFAKSTSRVTVEVDEDGQKASELSNMSFKAPKTVPSYRKMRSIGGPEISTFRVNRPFVAITVIKGKTFSEIFFMNFLGSHFTRADYAQNTIYTIIEEEVRNNPTNLFFNIIHKT